MARRPRFLRPAIDAALPEINARLARVARETGLSAEDVIDNMRAFDRIAREARENAARLRRED